MLTSNPSKNQRVQTLFIRTNNKSHPEDEGSTELWNSNILSQRYAVSQPISIGTGWKSDHRRNSSFVKRKVILITCILISTVAPISLFWSDLHISVEQCEPQERVILFLIETDMRCCPMGYQLHSLDKLMVYCKMHGPILYLLIVWVDIIMSTCLS
jgi:hypothetical protein